MTHDPTVRSNDPTHLAIKIGKYIQASRGCSYTDIKNQAALRGIDQDTLEQALLILHRQKTIHRTVSGGDVQYLFRVPTVKPVTAVSHVEWVKGTNDQGVPNYPLMTSENDGSGIDIDFSWLFLSPEELDKYKADLRGVAYIPKKRYVHNQVWFTEI